MFICYENLYVTKIRYHYQDNFISWYIHHLCTNSTIIRYFNNLFNGCYRGGNWAFVFFFFFFQNCDFFWDFVQKCLKTIVFKIVWNFSDFQNVQYSPKKVQTKKKTFFSEIFRFSKSFEILQIFRTRKSNKIDCA